MAYIKNLNGKKFNYLTVLSFDQNTLSRKSMWLCKCDCGNQKAIESYCLQTGKIKSCGCMKNQLISKNQTIHGQKHTRFYNRWASMKGRCQNINNKSYSRYGGRGIKICKRWENFKSFYEDMHPSFVKGLEIDRINNDGNYEPNNCHWVSGKENCRNKSNTVKFKNESAKEASFRLGGSQTLVSLRIRNGWSLERAFTEPVHYRGGKQC